MHVIIFVFLSNMFCVPKRNVSGIPGFVCLKETSQGDISFMHTKHYVFIDSTRVVPVNHGLSLSYKMRLCIRNSMNFV